MRNLNFVYFGSGHFSLIVLKDIVSRGYIPSMLVCNSDKPVGRKHILTAPETKKFIQNNFPDIKILQPKNKKELSLYSNDFFKMKFGIVSAYSKIIPLDTIDKIIDGIIGVHPSLLPKYRGASPIQSAILLSEKITGTTIYQMDEKIDNGPIIKQKKLNEDISDITYFELEEKLAILSAEILIDFMENYENKILIEQDNSSATYTKKFKTEDGFVDLKKDSPEKIYNKIRALNPDPGVYAIIDDIRTKLLEAKKDEKSIIITKIIPAGKKEREVKIIL